MDEIFPWDFIDTGVTKEFLKARVEECHEGDRDAQLPRMRCSGCGAKQFGGGVCYEN